MLRVAEIRGRVIYRFTENINITKKPWIVILDKERRTFNKPSYFQFSFFFLYRKKKNERKKSSLQLYPYVKRAAVETDENKERKCSSCI